jgi:hypothetical protein
MSDNEQEIEEQLARYRAMTDPVSFDAGFTDRVMSRLAMQPKFADVLQSRFWRVGPLALAAAMLLATLNVLQTRTASQPMIDRVLGITPTSVTGTDAIAFGLDDDLSAWGR